MKKVALTCCVVLCIAVFTGASVLDVQADSIRFTETILPTDKERQKEAQQCRDGASAKALCADWGTCHW